MLPTISMPASHSERVPLCLSRLRRHLVASPFAEPLRGPCSPDMQKVPGHAWSGGDLEGGARV